MTSPAPTAPDRGTQVSSLQFNKMITLIHPPRPASTVSLTANPLERLAQLVHSNDRLMDELAASRAKIVAARNYLDRAGSNASFGLAHLERCRNKHAMILSQLRANRIESLALLDSFPGNSALDA